MNGRYLVFYTDPGGGIRQGDEFEMLLLALDEAQRLFTKVGVSDVTIYDETRRTEANQ